MAILTKRMFMNAHYKYRRSDVNIGPTSFFWKFVSDTCMDKQESDVYITFVKMIPNKRHAKSKSEPKYLEYRSSNSSCSENCDENLL